MEPSFPFLVSAFVIALAVRDVYELLKESGKITAGNTPAFIVVFMAMGVLWASWFMMCREDPWRREPPGVVHAIGFTIAVIGTVLAVGALVQLRGLEGIDHLVTRGLFRRLRHPMYLGFMMWIVGWVLYHGAVLTLLPGALCIASILWWRHLEDRRLAVQFGETYREYTKATWF